VVEDVVVCYHAFLFEFKLSYPSFVVFFVECIELSKSNNTITVRIDFEEELSDFRLPKGQVKVATETGLEILESEEAYP
jgi:hypothetical protein